MKFDFQINFLQFKKLIMQHQSQAHQMMSSGALAAPHQQAKKVQGSAIQFKGSKNPGVQGAPKKIIEQEAFSSTHQPILFKEKHPEIGPSSTKSVQQNSQRSGGASAQINSNNAQQLGSGRLASGHTHHDDPVQSAKVKQVNLQLGVPQSQYISITSAGSISGPIKVAKKHQTSKLGGEDRGSLQPTLQANNNSAQVKNSSKGGPVYDHSLHQHNLSHHKGGVQSTIEIQNKTRDLSSSSDKFNNSLLKLKSRNRCNDNFNLGGPADSHGSARTKNSNKDNLNKGANMKMNTTHEVIVSKDGGAHTHQPSKAKQNHKDSNKQVSQGQQNSAGFQTSSAVNKNIQNQYISNQIEEAANISNTEITTFQNKQQSSKVHNVVGSVDRKISLRDIPTQLDTSGGNLTLAPQGSNMKKIVLSNEPLSCQNKVNQKEKLMMMKNFDQIASLKGMQAAALMAQSNLSLMAQKGFQSAIQMQNVMSVQPEKFGSQPQQVIHGGSTTLKKQQNIEETKVPQNQNSLEQKKSPNHSKNYVSRLAQNLQQQPVTKISKAAVKVVPDLMHTQQIIQTERVAIGSKLSLSNELSSVREVEMSTTLNYSNLNVRQEDGSTGMMIVPPEGETGCSPKINFYPSNPNHQHNALKRGGAGSSMPVGSNGQKRRHQLKTGSYNKRHTTDEGTHSSPSAGGGNHQANMSSSACNKSAHYGLSSQSFMTNSNSNGGSLQRQGHQDTGVISQTGVNTSNYNNSFYNHHRQRSGGIHTQSSGAPGENTNAQIQSAITLVPAQNHYSLAQASSSNSNQPQKKVAFGGATSSNSSNTATLSNRGISSNQPISSITQKASQTQKINFNTLQIHQTPVQTEPKAVQISNKQKKGATTSNNSSRSNSIRKRENFGKVMRKQNVALKPNFFSQNQIVPNDMSHNDISQQDIMNNTSQLIINPDSKMNNSLIGKRGQSLMGQNNPPQKANANYNHTVEDDDFRDSLNRSSNQQLFGNEMMISHQALKSQVNLQKKAILKKKDLGGVNRSVIVEPSTLKGIIRFQDLLPQGANVQKDHGKHTPSNIIMAPCKDVQSKGLVEGEKTPGQVPNLVEIETMKRELENKDIVIQNLRDRLQNLEDKVNGITQMAQVKNQKSENKEDDEEQNQRDKSQQRIKEAIMNLEMKLEQFRLEKEMNNLKLEEMKQYSSSQHSSSRHSDLNYQNLLGRNILGTHQSSQLTNLNSGQHLTRAQNYLPSGFGLSQGNNGGVIFTGTSLGGGANNNNNRRRSENSLIDDLESLITITEHDEAVARAIGSGIQEQRIFFNNNNNIIQNSAKIKTPMFDDVEGRIGGILNDDMDSENDQQEEDNSCLIMLEKEWQEAQKQKQQHDDSANALNINKSGGNLFDQSLISGQNNLQLKNYNQTQNNIVFFFDEGDAMDHSTGGNQPIDLDDIELAARDGKEKFIKTQKIELKEMATLAAPKAKLTKVGESLSPQSSSNIMVAQKQDKKDALSQASSNNAPTLAPTFSRTLSKTTLLAKIRNAIGKQADIPQVAVGGAGVTISQAAKKNQQQQIINEKKTPKQQPRRFIVKRSQERTGVLPAQQVGAGNNTNSSAVAQQYTSMTHHSTSNPRLKMKNQKTSLFSGVVLGGASNATTNHNVLSQPTFPSQSNQPQQYALDSASAATIKHHSTQLQVQQQQKQQHLQQQEVLMKSMLQQKEKFAQSQKEVIKQEREVSLKLRQAIQKLNLKIQMQSTAVHQESSTSGGGAATIGKTGNKSNKK